VVDAGSGRKFVEFTSGNVQASSSKRLLGELGKGPAKLPTLKKKESSDRLAG